MILFRLSFRRFSTEAYTSILRCCSGRNWTKREVHKMRQKPTPNWTFALHLRTDTQAATASEIEGRSWWGQKRRTRCFRKLEVATQQHKKHRKAISFRAREPSAMAASPMKKRLSPSVCCSPGGCFFNLFLGRTRNSCGRENYVTVRGCTSLIIGKLVHGVDLAQDEC